MTAAVRSTNPDELDEILQRVFGHRSLLPLQRRIIERLMAGGSALAVMPTGWGKSICYQVPALAMPGPGVTLVMSPLIALMEDQVGHLRSKGVRAAYVNSTLRREEREERCDRLASGSYDLLYATPERMESPRFREALARVPGGVKLLAVDEAHCIAQWGHDFRPAYQHIGRYRREIGHPPVIALTATATSRVRDDIRQVLGEDTDSMPLHHLGLDRPNLELSSRPVLDDDEKIENLVSLLDENPGTAIVYVTLIKDLEIHADRLHDRLPGRRVETYHGRMNANARKALSRRFTRARPEEGLVLVATNAFGMGIDKPDIRLIVHAQIPGSIEAYYQEVGRAGRDGLPARCVLLASDADVAIQHQFIDWKNPPVDMVERVARLVEESGHNDFDPDDVSQALHGRRRHDPRAEACLIHLEEIGVLGPSPVPGRYESLRPLAPGDLSPERRAEKKRQDLLRLRDLIAMTRAASIREHLLAYFD